MSAAGPTGAAARPWANRVRLLVLAQVAMGVVNLGLLAPLWAQMLHLLLADLLWIALVALGLDLLRAAAPVPAVASPPLPAQPAPGAV